MTKVPMELIDKLKDYTKGSDCGAIIDSDGDVYTKNRGWWSNSKKQAFLEWVKEKNNAMENMR